MYGVNANHVAASVKPGRHVLRAVYRLLELIKARCAIYRQLTSRKNGALVMALKACAGCKSGGEKSGRPKPKRQEK
jgi:hypothetical protein